MKIFSFSFIFIFVFIMVLCTSAMASTYVYFPSLTFNGISMPQYGGEKVGPIDALKYDKESGIKTPIENGLTCVDFLTPTYIPGTYGFDIFALNLNSMSSVKFQVNVSGVFSAYETLKLYEKVAWLYLQIDSNKNHIGEIQFAIWDIFESTAVSKLNKNQKNDVNFWLELANENYDSLDYSNIDIYVPEDFNHYSKTSSGPQEFITKHDPSVPEPFSMILFGIGLIALGYERKISKKG